jgi:alkylation response protein AidB-like acyl-CoA dehydrogenase
MEASGPPSEIGRAMDTENWADIFIKVGADPDGGHRSFLKRSAHKTAPLHGQSEIAKPCDHEGANGISAFMVHKDDEGFSVGPKERKIGIKGSPTAELYFENCYITGDRIIGEPGSGLKTALKTLDHTRPTVGAQAVGVAQGALDVAVAYTKDRKQFGKSISSFQAIQFELADMAMKIEAARLMVYTAAARAHRGETNLAFISAAAKCFASDVAMDVTESAVQQLRGAGYTRDFPAERMMRDAKITQIYGGTNQIQHIVMSRALLAG